MQKDNDYELLYLIHANDEQAYSFLFEKYERIIRHIISKYIKKKERLYGEDDFVQMARLKLLQAVQNYREDRDSSFGYFFYEIFEHAMIDYYRSRYTKKGAIDHLSESLDTCVSEFAQSYRDEEEIENFTKELCARMKQTQVRMNPMERCIIQLRAQGYSYAQIAMDLGINEKKVDNTIRKFKRQKK